MTNAKTTLNLHIKGKFKKFWTSPFLNTTLKRLGVEVHTIKDHSGSHLQIVVSGRKENLWDVIKWAKGASVFYQLNEVAFEFVD